MKTRRKTPLNDDNIEPHQCTIAFRLEILRQVPFFTALAPEALSHVNTLFREQGYLTGDVIYYAGDPAERLYVVAAGKVKLIRHTLAGQDVVLEILTPGEFFGYIPVLGGERYSDTTQALTTSCILTISPEDFQSVLRSYPSVPLALLDIVSEQLKTAREVIHQLSAHSVESRVAAALLKLADKVGEKRQDGVLLQVPLSRQDLAEMTGATVETVSRIMSEFRKDKIIQSGRRWIAILEPDTLAAIAGVDAEPTQTPRSLD